MASLLKLFLNKLSDKHEYVRRASVGILSSLLPLLSTKQTAPLLKAFQNAFVDQSEYVRNEAHEALQKIDDKVWQSSLQHQLQAKPLVSKQQDMEDPLKADLRAWAYILLRGSFLVYFGSAEQKELPSYKLLIEALKTQANTWKWPVHGYTTKALADDFNPSFPKLPAPIIHRAMVYTPLHQAAEKGDIDELEALWQDSYYHRYLNHQHNKAQSTPLLCALKNKQWKAAEWLIHRNAWIDVSDIQGNDCLQLVFDRLQQKTDDLERENLKQQFVGLLSQRMLFPMARIKRAIGYGEEKEQSQKTYDKELCITVAQLLGDSVDALSKLLHDANKRKLYRAAARNILYSTQERLGDMGFIWGWNIDFLRFRIAILYDLLVKIKKEHFISQLPTRGKTDEHYANDEVYERGVQELQSILTTFWDYKILMRDHEAEEIAFDMTTFYKAWAQGIVHRLPHLTFPQEVSLYLGHRGHCLYVSFTKMATHYVIRVDNRWLHDNVPSDSHPKDIQAFYDHHTGEETTCICLQPYTVAYFPVQAWDKHELWLLKYIMDAGQVRNEAPSKAIPYLYDTKHKAPKKGQKPKWITEWPWRPEQTTAQNCYMRSHNVGYRIRLGNDVYKWFRKKSLRSYLLERQFIEDQLSFVQPEEKDKRKYPTRLPKHEEVIECFSEQLGVGYNDVNMEVVAEQALVHYAGITNRSQRGAKFGRDHHTGHTWFKLMISGKMSKFKKHYETCHPGAIKNLEVFDEEYLFNKDTEKWMYVVFDTLKLYYEIIPKLTPLKPIVKEDTRLKMYNSQLKGDPNTMGSIKRTRPQKRPKSTIALNDSLYKQDVIHSQTPLRSQAVITEITHHLLQEDTKEVVKKVVNKEDIKHPLPKKIQFNKTYSSQEPPTHRDLIQRFSQQLEVNYKGLDKGTIAQQALVGYAGITRIQTGATFGKDRQTGRTWFRLHLQRNEFEDFMNHYLEYHPGAIKKIKTLANEWVRITFDTILLYQQIIPKLLKPKKESITVEKSIEGFVKSISNNFNDEQQIQLMKMLSENQLPPSSSLKDSKQQESPNRLDEENTKQEPPEPKQRTSPKKQPTQEEVIKRFSQQLRKDYNAIDQGTFAQQALVDYTNITRTQTGATFGNESNTGHTWFKLCLTSDETELFMGHYQTLHPDAIKKRKTLGNGWVRITFDTKQLYDKIIPKLS